MPHLYISILTIAIVGILIQPSYGLGINCRGSILCDFPPALDSGTYLQIITDQVCGLDGNTVFSPGQHMAASCIDSGGGFAAFTQNTDQPFYAVMACNLLHVLQDHGCKTCGSVPFDVSGANDVNNGELTVRQLLTDDRFNISIFLFI